MCVCVCVYIMCVRVLDIETYRVRLCVFIPLKAIKVIRDIQLHDESLNEVVTWGL